MLQVAITKIYYTHARYTLKIYIRVYMCYCTITVGTHSMCLSNKFLLIPGTQKEKPRYYSTTQL